MTQKQPEALKLAFLLDSGWSHPDEHQQAANELRRLAAIEEQHGELLEALKWAMNRINKKAPHEAIEGDGELYAFVAAVGAIAKAEGGAA
jgi:hypothetical protein